jgi:hypothetical protein
MESLRVRAQRFEGGKNGGSELTATSSTCKPPKDPRRNGTPPPRLASLPLRRARESHGHGLRLPPQQGCRQPRRTGCRCLGLERGMEIGEYFSRFAPRSGGELAKGKAHGPAHQAKGARPRTRRPFLLACSFPSLVLSLLKKKNWLLNLSQKKLVTD